MLSLRVTLVAVLACIADAQINLGSAAAFGVLGGSTVSNTGASTINGDLGVYPGTAITGVAGVAVVTGTIHDGDAIAEQAQADALVAYNEAAGLGGSTDLTGQDLGGKVLIAGVYKFDTSAQLTGTLTLDAQGNPNALFVFQIGSTLNTAVASSIVLVNGASYCNVYFQVGTSATLGTSTLFQGSILASASISLGSGATSNGGLYALNGAVTLIMNTVTPPQ
ncbi:hypothetical protein MMC25_000230, partial [Agyrium rufum]|nr:hypothetical protein [Agyrium rufum]